MTIRDLIDGLSSVDEDIKDYEVWVTASLPLSKDVKLNYRTNITKIPENVDVSEKRIYLRTVK